MGMFTDLMNKIFRPSTGASAQPAPGATAGSAQTSPGGPSGGGGGSAAAAEPVGAVDVAAILDEMARENKQKLD